MRTSATRRGVWEGSSTTSTIASASTRHWGTSPRPSSRVSGKRSTPRVRECMFHKPRRFRVQIQGRTSLTLVALSLRLGRIVPLFRDPRRVAMGTSYTLGPAQLADRLEALDVVDEVLNVDHRP